MVVRTRTEAIEKHRKSSGAQAMLNECGSDAYDNFLQTYSKCRTVDSDKKSQYSLTREAFNQNRRIISVIEKMSMILGRRKSKKEV